MKNFKYFILVSVLSIMALYGHAQYIDTTASPISGDIYHTGGSLSIGDTADGDAK